MTIAATPYPALGALRVDDAMHPGLISCSPDTPLRTVARMMATFRVHAILVNAHDGEPLTDAGVWGVVSDTDLLAATRVETPEEQTARTTAATPALTVSPRDGLARAAQLMLEHEVSHVVVVEGHPPRPIGVVSTLDVARALAGFPERHPFRP
jgi:CBS domain-containing protein